MLKTDAPGVAERVTWSTEKKGINVYSEVLPEQLEELREWHGKCPGHTQQVLKMVAIAMHVIPQCETSGWPFDQAQVARWMAIMEDFVFELFHFSPERGF